MRSSQPRPSRGEAPRFPCDALNVQLMRLRLRPQGTETWLDGKSVFELSEAEANVAIDAAKFAKPSAPKPAP